MASTTTAAARAIWEVLFMVRMYFRSVLMIPLVAPPAKEAAVTWAANPAGAASTA